MGAASARRRRTFLKGALVGGAILAGAGFGPQEAAVATGGSRAPRRWDFEADFVSLGASSGGLVGAMVAKDAGLSAVVLEAGELVGSGTAVSNGGLWIPLSRLQRQAGYPDSKEIASNYVRSTGFGRHDEAKLSVFLDRGSEVIDYLNGRTACRIVVNAGADYIAHDPDSRPGRHLWPDIANAARVLGARADEPLVRKLRRPYLLMNVGDQPGVTEQLGGGNALIGTLVVSCLDRGIPILTETRARELIVESGRVVGVRTTREGRDYFVRGRRAVLIATGGYDWNQELHRQFAPLPGPILAGTPPVNVGDGLLMGMAVGGATGLMDQSVWMATVPTPGDPVRAVPWSPEGVLAVFLPGQIIVNRAGKRFCDESFYPAIPKGMTVPPVDREAQFPNFPAFVIMDQAFRDRNEFVTAPRGTEMRPWLQRGESLEALARQLGVDGAQLTRTVAEFNANSKRGIDPQFGRGAERANPIVREARERAGAGRVDGTGVAQPPLGTLEKPPFYGARLGLGTQGTRGGLLTDTEGRVLRVSGETVPGLYATSNAAAQSAFGGGYTSGMSIGLSLVFGYIAGRHAGAGQGAAAGGPTAAAG